MSAPRPEIAHWLTASLFLFMGLVLLSEAIVGTDVFRRRPWRAYLFPVVAVVGGVFLWLIAALSTFSTHAPAGALRVGAGGDDRRRRPARGRARQALSSRPGLSSPQPPWC